MELRHAILGLLAQRPMSGYDLGRVFQGSVAHFWHADLSQIYRTLRRLADDGAIDTQTIPQDGKPDRKVHSLTEAGTTALREWLASPLETEQVKDPFLARLFFVESLGRDAALRLLDERAAQTEAVLATLSAIDIPGDSLRSTLYAATRANGVHHARAELEWIQHVRQQLDDTKE
ncbi:PadR family transcriptional regulator [Kribbia dieselivorans]|uniref:PadR family transcriptional regulator n=1 Tax=Kribbia dieselivorans TaxID=331526 RepID=UPI000838F343